MTPVRVPVVSFASFDWRRMGGVGWISSFVMEYSFLWLSALSDHADSLCIECDSWTKPLTHRPMPLWLHRRMVLGSTSYDLSGRIEELFVFYHLFLVFVCQQEKKHFKQTWRFVEAKEQVNIFQTRFEL